MKRFVMMFLEVGAIIALGIWLYFSLMKNRIVRPGGVEVPVQLSSAGNKAVLFRGSDGQYRYAIAVNGVESDLTPEEMAARVHQEGTQRTPVQKLLNVNTAIGYAWVTLGFVGQVIFMGRMVVQWLVSEKNKKSTVPTIFWWMSLVGSSMLVVYFIWRRDIVGVLGQAFGWVIYIRNLWLIYRPAEPHTNGIMEAEVKEGDAVVMPTTVERGAV
jgi:lipid-A-disaccharide synthase-like uncharacterized protein